MQVSNFTLALMSIAVIVCLQAVGTDSAPSNVQPVRMLARAPNGNMYLVRDTTVYRPLMRRRSTTTYRAPNAYYRLLNRPYVTYQPPTRWVSPRARYQVLKPRARFPTARMMNMNNSVAANSTMPTGSSATTTPAPVSLNMTVAANVTSTVASTSTTPTPTSVTSVPTTSVATVTAGPSVTTPTVNSSTALVATDKAYDELFVRLQNRMTNSTAPEMPASTSTVLPDTEGTNDLSVAP